MLGWGDEVLGKRIRSCPFPTAESTPSMKLAMSNQSTDLGDLADSPSPPSTWLRPFPSDNPAESPLSIDLTETALNPEPISASSLILAAGLGLTTNLNVPSSTTISHQQTIDLAVSAPTTATGLVVSATAGLAMSAPTTSLAVVTPATGLAVSTAGSTVSHAAASSHLTALMLSKPTGGQSDSNDLGVLSSSSIVVRQSPTMDSAGGATVSITEDSVKVSPNPEGCTVHIAGGSQGRLSKLAEHYNTITVLQFTEEQLSLATDNFSETRKLGCGGFGTVYKGWLKGHNVAVKKLSQV